MATDCMRTSSAALVARLFLPLKIILTYNLRSGPIDRFSYILSFQSETKIEPDLRLPNV